MIGRRAICALAGALAGAACGGRMFTLPTGTGQPAPEAAAAYAEATAACRGVTTYSARVSISHLSGFIDGILTSAGEIYLLYSVSGQAGFELQGTAEGATLVLRQEGRFVKARADEIVNALIGAPLGPRDLLAVLTGCGTSPSEVTNGMRHGDVLGVTVGDRQVFLKRPSAVWQVAAAKAPQVLVDYQKFEGTWPHSVRLEVQLSGGDQVRMSLTLDQMAIDQPANPRAFVPRALPEGATPMTLADLREIGPLRGRK